LYYVLQKLHILPSVFLALSSEEQAFICACVELKYEADKKELSKIKKK